MIWVRDHPNPTLTCDSFTLVDVFIDLIKLLDMNHQYIDYSHLEFENFLSSSCG